jgi:hypothetical protein
VTAPATSRNAARFEHNVLDRRATYYAFVFDIHEDCDEQGRWIVDMELLDAAWFDRTWKELGAKDGALLAAQFGSSDFDAVFFDLPRSTRERMIELHLEYTRRLIDPADPAPVALLQTVLAPSGYEQKTLRVAYWYVVELGTATPFTPVASYADAPERESVFSEHALLYEDDPPPVLRDLLRLVSPRPPIDSILKMLHLPQGIEDLDATGGKMPAPRPPINGSSGTQRTPEGGGTAAAAAWAPARIAARIRAKAARLGERLAEWLGWPWDGTAPALVTAGFPFPATLPPARIEEAQPAPRPVLQEEPLAYVGSPTVMGVQMPNPMVRAAGAHQPFVGVLNVGQGNCCALYDEQGRITSYFDFGMPKNGRVASAPPILNPPCVHDDPIIIASHWDYDHIAMARRQRHAWDMMWIAPQQHIGAVSGRGVYAAVVNSANGGMLYRWPAHGGAPPIEHVATPWGYLERGTVNNQLGAGSLNDGGLVAYVCVKDNAAAGPAGGVLVAAAPFNGRPAGAPLAVAARTRAALTDALLAPIARRWPKIAEAATVAVGEFVSVAGGAAPLANTMADATEGALLHIAAGGGAGWAAILAGLGGAPVPPAIVAGAVSLAAAALAPALGAHVGLANSGLAIAAAELALANSITGLAGGGFTLADIVAAAAIADTVAAEVAAGGAGLDLPNLTNAARISATAMAVTAAVAVMMPGAAVPAAVLAGNVAAARAAQLVAAIRATANAAAGASAEVATVGGLAAALPAAQLIAGAGLAVRSVAGGGNWAAALAAIAAGPGCPLITNPAVPLAVLLAAAPGAPASAEDAASNRRHNVAGSVHAAATGGGAAVEDGAAALALTDAAATAWAGAAMPVITMQARNSAVELAWDAGLAFPIVNAPVVLPMAYAGPGALPPGHLAIPGGALVVGHAPHDPEERYILLPGDTSPIYIPSTDPAFGVAHAPIAVGFVPPHHGAVTVFAGTQAVVTAAALDERSETKARLPWAPGTSAAAAGAAAGHAATPFGGAVPDTKAKAVAAASAYAATEVARAANVYVAPANLLPSTDLAHAGSVAADTAHGGGAWFATLQSLSMPPAFDDAHLLTQCAARMVPLLAPIAGAHANINAALAAMGGVAALTAYTNLAEVTAVAACVDAAVALAALPAGSAAAALGLLPAAPPVAVSAAAHAVAVAVAAAAGVPLAGIAPVAAGVALAATLGLGMAMLPEIRAIAAAAVHAAAEVSGALGLGPVSNADVLAAAAAVHGSILGGGTWLQALDQLWTAPAAAPTMVRAAAAISPSMHRPFPLPATADAAITARGAEIVDIATAPPTLAELAAVAAIADAAEADTATGAVGAEPRLAASEIAHVAGFALVTPPVGAAGVEAAAANALTGAMPPATQAIAAAAASAAAEVATATNEPIVPAAHIVAAAAAATNSIDWAAAMAAIQALGAAGGRLSAATTFFTAPWGGLPATAGALALAHPEATAYAIVGHPNAAEVAAVTAAVHSATAIAAFPAAAAAIVHQSGAAATAAINSVCALFGAVAPAAQETFPGVGTSLWYGFPVATIQAALEVDLRNAAGGAVPPNIPNVSRRHAQAAAAVPKSGKTAYSYGVHSVGLNHFYAAVPGPYGHAHPRAVVQYAGRGWIERLNTSVDAWQGLQPDPFPAVGAATGGGNIALGWEVDGGNLPDVRPYEGPVRADNAVTGLVERNNCPLCGIITFQR